jgi:hypothetical protein
MSTNIDVLKQETKENVEILFSNGVVKAVNFLIKPLTISCNYVVNTLWLQSKLIQTKKVGAVKLIDLKSTLTLL